MKQLSLCLLLFVFAVSGSAQSVITIQRGTTTLLTNFFDSAIINAQNGDVIYLPGGVVSSSSNISINKKVSIFGAGYREDSSSVTHATILQASITLNEGAEGSLLSGFSVNFNLTINCGNVTVKRCNLSNLYVLSSNTLIQENIIQGPIYGNNIPLKNNLFLKNVVYAWIDGVIGGDFLNNNLVENITYLLIDGTNSSFYNNIICTQWGLSQNTNLTLPFKNNLFAFDNGLPYNFVQSLDSIFYNFSGGNPSWNLSQNFKLKAGCIGIKAGTDGSDVGIYGTAVPFKSSTLPINPHIQSVSIPNAVGQNGSLSINIKVAAQNQ